MRNRVKLAILAGCCVVAVVGPAPNPYLRSSLEFHDFLHVLAFAAIAALLLVGQPVRTGPVRRRLATLGWVLVCAVLVGVLIELLQWVFGGDADPWDVARDTAGALATLLVAHSFWPDIHAVRRWGLLAGAVILVVACARPTALALNDESRARREFPVLADFSSARQLDRFEWQPLAPAIRVCDGDRASASSASVQRDNACVARVSLSPGRYPGFTLRYFPRDWRGYQRFVLSCTNPSADPLRINIRIDDMRHNNEYTDRFNGTYVLAPGRNEIRVPLSEIERAPRGREMDLEHIRSVIVFAYRLNERREIEVERLRLE